MTARKLIASIPGLKSRRHFRLLRGRFSKAVSCLSSDLQDSCLRTFDRKVRATFPNGLPY